MALIPINLKDNPNSLLTFPQIHYTQSSSHPLKRQTIVIALLAHSSAELPTSFMERNDVLNTAHLCYNLSPKLGYYGSERGCFTAVEHGYVRERSECATQSATGSAHPLQVPLASGVFSRHVLSVLTCMKCHQHCWLFLGLACSVFHPRLTHLSILQNLFSTHCFFREVFAILCPDTCLL